MTARRFFETPAKWRAWLDANHAKATEVIVGFHKRGTGTPSITWPESVDEALCFGWIDGVRRRIDEERYEIRFTPRKKTSIWSTVNVKRVAELEAEGRMRPAGLAAFAARKEARTSVYAYEQRTDAALPPEYEKRLRANAAAWKDWSARPPGYRKTAAWRVISAKQEATREKRLLELIEDSANGRMIKELRRR
jgi:uncharacterized protein YdeI (YjbR/CyaY-like superfamily)